MDLKMGKGKIAAQACHASFAAIENAQKRWNDWFIRWLRNGQPIIVVKAESKEEIDDIIRRAKRKKIPCGVVKDAGRTQVPSGTKTAIAIGPGPQKEVDELTGTLKLL